MQGLRRSGYWVVLSTPAIFAVPQVNAASCVSGAAWHIESEGFGARAVDVPVQCNGDQYMVTPDAMSALGFDISLLPTQNGLVALAEGGALKIDENDNKITVQVRPAWLPKTVINMAQSNVFMQPANRASGGFVNYDVRAIDNLGAHSLTGLFDANTETEYGLHFNLQSLLRSSRNAGPRYERLAASLSKDDAASASTWLLGDGISLSGENVNPVRFTGFQYRSDFSIQPGFITQPTFDFTGTAATRSTLDVLLDNKLVRREEVNAGPVNLQNLVPFIGASGAQIIIRDAFGQQSVITAPLLGNANLLKAGLANFAIQAGKLRITNNRSDGFFTSSYYRRGLTSYATVEANIEKSVAAASLPSVQHFGGSVTLATLIGNVSLGQRNGNGQLRNLSYQNAFRTADTTSVFSASQARRMNYRVLGSPADPVTDKTNLLQLSVQWNRGFSATLLRAAGNNVVTQNLSAAYMTRSNGRALNYSFSLSRTIIPGSTTRTIALFGISILFDIENGRLNSTDAGLSRSESGRLDHYASYDSRPLEGIGASVSLRQESVLGRQQLSGVAGYSAIPYETSLLLSSSRLMGIQASIRGAFGWHRNETGWMRYVNDGYAVVDAGFPNVGVTINNAIRGQTNATGVAFASGINSYQASQISLDSNTSPPNFDGTVVRASSYRRAGVMVKIRPAAAAMVVIPDISTGVLNVGTHTFPITDRGAFVELPEGDYEGVVDGKIHVRFSIPAPTATVSTVQSVRAKRENQKQLRLIP